MPGGSAIGAAPAGAPGRLPFVLRARTWRAAAVFGKEAGLAAVFDKAAAVAVTVSTEE